MANPDYFLLLDSETTQDNLVADFGAILTNRKGKIITQCAVLTHGIYTNSEKHPLFHLFGDSGDIWSKASLPKRYTKYNRMVEAGTRQIASVGAINRWLCKVVAEYNPYLTAYNLAFDRNKCDNTGIDLSIFEKHFCLMLSAQAKWGTSKRYLKFILENHYFISPTSKGNMSYKTSAEVMTKFILNNPDLENEPHTAIEDVLYYELPILLKLVKTTKKEQWLNPKMSTWRDRQVKNWYKPK